MSASILRYIPIGNFLAFMIALLLGACGGGGGGGDDGVAVAPPEQPAFFAQGIYAGTSTDIEGETTEMLAVIASDGTLEAISLDQGSVIYGALSPVSASEANGDIRGLTAPGNYWSINGQEAIDAKISISQSAADQTIDGSVEYQAVTQASFTLDNYSADYNGPPLSFAEVAGNYHAESNNVDIYISIDANGAIAGYNTSGCQISAQLTQIDPGKNLYSLSMTLSSCGSGDGVYTGKAFFILSQGEEPQIAVIGHDTTDAAGGLFTRQSQLGEPGQGPGPAPGPDQQPDPDQPTNPGPAPDPDQEPDPGQPTNPGPTPGPDQKPDPDQAPGPDSGEPLPAATTYEVRVTGQIYISSNIDFIPIGTSYNLAWRYDSYERAYGDNVDAESGVCVDPYECDYYSGLAVHALKLAIANASNATATMIGRDGIIYTTKDHAGSGDSLYHGVGEYCQEASFSLTGGLASIICSSFTLSAASGGVLSSPSLVYPVSNKGWDDVGISLEKAISQGASSEINFTYYLETSPDSNAERARGTISTLTIESVRE